MWEARLENFDTFKHMLEKIDPDLVKLPSDEAMSKQKLEPYIHIILYILWLNSKDLRKIEYNSFIWYTSPKNTTNVIVLLEVFYHASSYRPSRRFEGMCDQYPALVKCSVVGFLCMMDAQVVCVCVCAYEHTWMGGYTYACGCVHAVMPFSSTQAW